MTTSAHASFAHLLSRSLLAAAIAGTTFLTACGGGSDAGTASASQTAADHTAAAAPATPASDATTATDTAAADTTTTDAAATDSATADAAQADAIRTASALAGTAGTASLSWKAVTGAVSYRVYYGTASRTYVQPLGAGVASATAAITLSGLTSGQTYWFSVTGVDANGKETAYSDEMTKLVS